MNERPEESVNIHLDQEDNILNGRILEEKKVISEEQSNHKEKDLEERFNPYLSFANQKTVKTCVANFKYNLKKQ